jgi:homoserine dehydrogenase
MDKINVGLIGFGTVGSGVVKILNESAEVIRDKVGVEIVLKRIADQDTERDRGVDIGSAVLTAEASDVLNDPDINIVVELVGGTGVAKDFVLEAMKGGKHVVTANKALLSTHGKEIFSKSMELGLQIGFEASVGGGIPILKALKEGLAANRIDSIYGIINGTANYILTLMTEEGGDFDEVLSVASDLGYAEADPSYDVDGIDTAHKLALLIDIAYGTYVSHNDIYTEGIRNITPTDIDFASEFGYTIKLLAIAKVADNGIEARVHPTMVPTHHPIAAVGGVYNAVFVHGDAVGSTMHYGQGAGMMPTASAVVADIVDIARDLKLGIPSRISPLGYTEEAIKEVKIKPIAELEIPYYLRFSAKDEPGVLSKLSGALGDHGISILSVIQEGRETGGTVPLVIVTHTAKEAELQKALEEIKGMDIIEDEVLLIRIEENPGGVDQE